LILNSFSYFDEVFLRIRNGGERGKAIVDVESNSEDAQAAMRQLWWSSSRSAGEIKSRLTPLTAS
jgi:hypothetical protein